MSKHEPKGSYIHASARHKANRQPSAPTDTRTLSAPQNPRVGSNDKNQYR